MGSYTSHQFTKSNHESELTDRPDALPPRLRNYFLFVPKIRGTSELYSVSLCLLKNTFPDVPLLWKTRRWGIRRHKAGPVVHIEIVCGEGGGIHGAAMAYQDVAPLGEEMLGGEDGGRHDSKEEEERLIDGVKDDGAIRVE